MLKIIFVLDRLTFWSLISNCARQLSKFNRSVLRASKINIKKLRRIHIDKFTSKISTISYLVTPFCIQYYDTYITIVCMVRRVPTTTIVMWFSDWEKKWQNKEEMFWILYCDKFKYIGTKSLPSQLNLTWIFNNESTKQEQAEYIYIYIYIYKQNFKLYLLMAYSSSMWHIKLPRVKFVKNCAASCQNQSILQLSYIVQWRTSKSKSKWHAWCVVRYLVRHNQVL